MKARIRTLLFTCLLAIGLIVARGASATPPAQATGNGTITSVVITLDRIADGNRFLNVTASGVLSGTFVGAFNYQLVEVVHEDGSVNFHGFGAFTGTSPCGTGTTAFEDNGSGPTTSIVGGHLATVGDTGAVHAVVDFTQVGPAFSHSGTFHCD